MRNPFRKREVWNAYGQSTESATARPFRKVVRVLCAFLLALVVAGSVFVQWHESRTVDARLVRMKGDAARIIADALDAKQNQREVLKNGQRIMTEWRARLRSVHPTKEQSPRLLALYELEGRQIPRWRRMLEGGAEEGAEMPFADRKRLVRQELLDAQEKWGSPPPPAIVFMLSLGSRRFIDGMVGGIIWPYGVVVRAWKQFSAGDARSSFGTKLRLGVFPWSLADFTAPWLLGFGIMAALVGYFLCWLGMKADSTVLGIFGMLFFFYVVVFVVCLFLLLAGVLA